MNYSEKTIQAGEFKAKCLALLDEVAQSGQILIIKKRGKAVAKLLPIEDPPSLKGSVTFKEDILKPIDVKWDALK